MTWRPHENSSAIGWRHPELDGLMDSADPGRFRGALPTVRRRSLGNDLGHAHVRRVDGYLVLDGL